MPRWTKKEEEFLKRNYEPERADQIARFLKKEVWQIKNKYRELVAEEQSKHGIRCPKCGSMNVNKINMNYNYCINCAAEFTNTGRIMTPIY